MINETIFITHLSIWNPHFYEILCYGSYDTSMKNNAPWYLRSKYKIYMYFHSKPKQKGLNKKLSLESIMYLYTLFKYFLFWKENKRKLLHYVVNTCIQFYATIYIIFILPKITTLKNKICLVSYASWRKLFVLNQLDTWY